MIDLFNYVNGIFCEIYSILSDLWKINPVSLITNFILSCSAFIALMTLRQNLRLARINNFITITNAHRDIWSKALNNETIQLCLKNNFDALLMNVEQRIFIRFIILHFSASYEARRRGGVITTEQLKLDARLFFTLPGPNAVWAAERVYQNKSFRKFVDNCIDYREISRLEYNNTVNVPGS